MCAPVAPPTVMSPVPKPKRQGHGRIKSTDYTGARWGEVPHCAPTLTPGCLCPLCAHGVSGGMKLAFFGRFESHVCVVGCHLRLPMTSIRYGTGRRLRRAQRPAPAPGGRGGLGGALRSQGEQSSDSLAFGLIVPFPRNLVAIYNKLGGGVSGPAPEKSRPACERLKIVR